MSLNKGITYVSAVLLIIFIVSIAGCKRKGQVSGQVTNIYDGTGIGGLKVSVSQEEKKVLGNTASEVGNAVTNSNGEFLISFSGNTRQRYNYRCGVQIGWNTEDTVSVFSENFIAFPPAIVSVPIEEKGSDNIQLSIAPASRVIFVISNNSGASIERFELGTIIKGTEFMLHTSSGGIAPILVAALPSNGQIHLILRMTRSGINSEKTDTVFVKPFEKTRHYIHL